MEKLVFYRKLSHQEFLAVKLSNIFLTPLFLLSALALAPSTGWAQDRHDKGESHEEEERMGDAYLPGLGISSRIRTQQRNGFVLHQVNVNGAGANILGDAGNEPSMTMDPTNPNKIAIGWRQFDNVASNFRQGGYGWSTDGGVTWGTGKHTPGTFRSDPVLDTTSNGIFHYNSLQQTFFSDEFRSNNGGASYSLLGPATGGDKQWIIIDKTTGSGSGFIYQWWSTAGNNYGGRQFSRSTDGGTTWMNPINVPQSPIWGTLAIGPNGELYFAGTASGQPGLRFVKSLDAKNSAVTPTFSVVSPLPTNYDVNNGQAINPGGLSGQVSCRCDVSNRPTRGNIYILSSLSYGSGTNPLDVFISRSTDGGTNWSSPLRVNQDPLNQGKYHWFGTLSVAPNGRLDATWFSTQEDPNNVLSALWYSSSLDAGVTWTAPVAVTDQFNSLVGWPNQNKMGDYMESISLNDSNNLAFACTLNGEQDVYFVKMPAPKLMISGKVTLQDYVGAVAGQVVTIETRDATTHAVLQTNSVTLNAAGNYSYELLPANTNQRVDYAIKGSHWLRKTILNQLPPLAGQTGVNVSLINGDCDNDNVISIFDYIVLSNAFDATASDTNWDPRADLDGDGVVSIFDYIIQSNNFDGQGDS